MKKTLARKVLMRLCIVLSGLAATVPVYATTLDLTDGGEGWINDGFFSVEEMNPAGTGYILPFVRLQSKDDESGTNTNLKVTLDEKTSWISVFQITSDYIFELDDKTYLNFILDINETAANSAINLTELILYLDESDSKYPYPDQSDLSLMAISAWNMDTGSDGDSTINLDYNYVSGGSGWWGDLSVMVPITTDDIGKYFYLYSAFTDADAGFEEWSIDPPVSTEEDGANSAGGQVPEPTTIFLFGCGLLSLAKFSRKKKI